MISHSAGGWKAQYGASEGHGATSSAGGGGKTEKIRRGTQRCRRHRVHICAFLGEQAAFPSEGPDLQAWQR